MDALAWKTSTGTAGGKKAAIPETKPTDYCNAKIVSFRLRLISACEAKLKSCKNPNSSPLISPLLPPLLHFPLPLKFLWFNKTSEVGVGRDTKPELNTREGINCNGQAVKTFERIEESFDNNDAEKESGSAGINGRDDSLESETCGGERYLQSNARHGNRGANEITLPVNNAQDSRDTKSNYVSPNHENKPEKCDEGSYNYWVARIMEFRSYWKEQKERDPNSSSNSSSTEIEQQQQQVDYSSEMHVSDSDPHKCFKADDLLCFCSAMKQEPVNEGDSFSGLLHPVSLSQTKVYAQMSFLCDQAYAIPEIKAEELWTFYRLRFVTSSLDKEAQVGVSRSRSRNISINNERDAEYSVAVQRAVAVDIDNQQTFTDSQQLSGMSKSNMATILATSSAKALVAGATEEDAKQGAAKVLQPLHSSPCDWFICDDDTINYTRYFVIQGSGSLSSWQANLFFEPTQFESFEVLVHRGIYEAAKGMYYQLLPHILSHLGKHGENARFGFTGHSLGGSLSLLVNLMLLIRGVISITSLLPVITFGSPCIMCGGDFLLHKLGLPYNHIQAVMMHRDIVPRAFACNYPDHVSEFLKTLNVSFRNHPCLNLQKFMYGSMGQLLILQPDEKTSPPHPLLPSGTGFYTLQLGAAQSAFFNTPHPLEILSDRCAYGSDGSISRDHDSTNYLKAINYIRRKQIKHLRKVQREQRRQIWRPLLTADSSMSSHRIALQSSYKAE